MKGLRTVHLYSLLHSVILATTAILGIDAQPLLVCKTGADLAVAMDDPGTSEARIVTDLHLSASDFTARSGSVPLHLRHNFTVAGPESGEPPVLNLTGVFGQVQLAAGVTITFRRLVLVGMREGPLVQAPGMDLLAASQPGAPSTLVLQDLAIIAGACMPSQDVPAASAAISSTIRPQTIPGVQLGLFHVLLPGCNATGSPIQFAPSYPAPTPPSWRPLGHCWADNMYFDDFALSGTTYANQTTTPSGYSVWMRNVTAVCPVIMPLACVREYGPVGCYSCLQKFGVSRCSGSVIGAPPPPPSPVDEAHIISGSELAGSGLAPVQRSSGGRNNVKAAVLAGVLGSVALIVLAALVAWGARRLRLFLRRYAGKAAAQDNDCSWPCPSCPPPWLRTWCGTASCPGPCRSSSRNCGHAAAGKDVVAHESVTPPGSTCDRVMKTEEMPVSPVSPPQQQQVQLHAPIEQPPVTLHTPKSKAVNMGVAVVMRATASTDLTGTGSFLSGSNREGGTGTGGGLAGGQGCAGGSTAGGALVTGSTEGHPNSAGSSSSTDGPSVLTLLPTGLGNGAHGRVVEGLYCGVRVAVKLLDQGLLDGVVQQQPVAVAAAAAVAVAPACDKVGSVSASSSALWLPLPVPRREDAIAAAGASGMAPLLVEPAGGREEGMGAPCEPAAGAVAVGPLGLAVPVAQQLAEMVAVGEAVGRMRVSPLWFGTHGSSSCSSSSSSRVGGGGVCSNNAATGGHVGASMKDGADVSTSQQLYANPFVERTAEVPLQEAAAAAAAAAAPEPPPPSASTPCGLRQSHRHHDQDQTGTQTTQPQRLQQQPTQAMIQRPQLETTPAGADSAANNAQGGSTAVCAAVGCCTSAGGGGPGVGAGAPGTDLHPVAAVAPPRTLMQEVEVLARCQHPNVVRLLAVCLRPPRPCLVMELMEISLDRLLHGGTHPPGPPLPLAKVLHIAIQVCHALEYLHPTIIHRDLKPGNVLISAAASPTPTAKLADFGLSRLNHSVIITKRIDVGTAAYMAPETWVTTNVIVTDKVDIYALGVMLFEMLAGQRPWAGLTMAQVAYAVEVGRQRPPLGALAPERCPAALAALIQQCWDHVPERRPAAAELAKELLVVMQRHSNH